MAQKIHIVLEDDLDGSEAIETVSFGLDGTSYEIDLNEQHATALRDALAGYIGHARKVGSAPRRGRKSSASSSAATDGPSAREIRDWARQNGHDVPDRGRVSAEVREAYDAAH
ncbi:histone-like nucleoid-structuring protein Lsr2 [Nocardioides dongkuii]|uniref:histone-like nucleoid-structuring protein Lsr2 n=1 Tax=Nocardioides dongkuii TaxID=2760089 RepID=UPI0015F8FDF8|nr:Lsr2 family protein [Nocardioides dongkuii]